MLFSTEPTDLNIIMKRICFIAQFPPPIHGLSKAVATLYSSTLQSKYLFRQVDTTNNRKILQTLWKIATHKSDLFYFTIAQTRGGNWRDLLILKLLQWKRSKCLIHLHGGYYRTLIEKDCGKLQRSLNYQAISHVSGTIILGNSLKNIFKGMINEKKIFVVPNCVDEEYMLNACSYKEKINLLASQPVLHILYLSNFIESKGYKEVLELAAKVQTEQKNTLHFHFAGKFFEEKERMYFENFITKHQLENTITYHGIVSGKKKNDLLNLCNIFILLTRYPNEGQPISILEAMGNAMAIITTNHAGIPDIATNKEHGLVIDKNYINLKEIYDYILRLDKERSLLRNICERNYNIAHSNYTEQQYINNMDNVFQKILEQ